MTETQALVAGTVLTMEGDERPLSPGLLRWQGDTLIEVREARPADVVEPGVLHAPSSVVLPGFINTHHHLASSLLTGLEGDPELSVEGRRSSSRRWLQRAQTRHTSYVSALHAYAQLIRAGVTTTTDSQAAWLSDDRTDGSLEAATRSGLRVVFSVAFLDRSELVPRDEQYTVQGALEELTRLRERWAGDRIEVEPEPLSLPRVSEPLLMALHGARRRLAMMHLTYSRAFERWADEELGRRAVEHLHHLGILDAGWLFAHPVHLDQRETDLLGEAGASVSWCPISNLALGLEVPDLRSLRSHGTPVGLGLDHPNGSHDVLANAKMGALLQRSVAGDADAWTSRHVLRQLTCEGAAALGLGGSTGSLRVGLQADLIVVDGSHPTLAGPGDLVERLVMAGAREAITDVMAGGRWLLRDGHHVHLDEQEGRAQVEAVSRSLDHHGPEWS